MNRGLLFSRRSFLQGSNAAILASLRMNSSLGQPMKLQDAKEAVDHLVLAFDDLQRGIDWVEKMTGVRAIVGGKHPNRGTQNALLSFGGRQYLEILAPDPQQANHPQVTVLAKFTSPRLVLWASATTQIEALAQQAKAAGLLAMGPMDGGRARPDGKMLKWRSLNVFRESEKEQAYFNVVPFFIQWDKDSLHPSQDSPTGCRLLSIEFQHPDVEQITNMMKVLGLKAKVGKAAAPAIKAVLQTPKGKVELN